MKLLSALILSLVFALQPARIQHQTTQPDVGIPGLLREAEQRTNHNCVKYLENQSAAAFFPTAKMKDGLWLDTCRRFDAGLFLETASTWNKAIVWEHTITCDSQ